MVYLDLSLGEGASERIPLWRGTDARAVSREVAAARSLDRLMETRLRQWLEQEAADAEARG